MTSFCFVNNACMLIEFPTAFQQFQKPTDIGSYKRQTFEVYGLERQQKLLLFPAFP